MTAQLLGSMLIVVGGFYTIAMLLVVVFAVRTGISPFGMLPRKPPPPPAMVRRDGWAELARQQGIRPPPTPGALE